MRRKALLIIDLRQQSEVQSESQQIWKYQETHPWLTFELDLRQFSHEQWLELGAIQSMCEQLSQALLSPSEAASLYTVYLAKGVAATTAIEGNTLTEQQVRERIENKRARLPASKQYLGTEVDNIIELCNLIANVMVDHEEDARLNLDVICNFNLRVLDGLEVEDGVEPGIIRKHSVGVANYRGAPHQDCEYLVERLCDFVNQPISRTFRMSFAVIRAVLAHLYIAWIHPFGDGNGRTARLVEFQILLGAGVPQIAAHLLSNHYNQTRQMYYRKLDECTKKRSTLPMIEYSIKGFIDQLRQQLQHVQNYARTVAWKDFVYETFDRLKSTAASDRQRELALALGRQKKRFISFSRVPELTVGLASRYAGKDARTITRDVNKLVELGLAKVRKKNGRRYVRANRNVLQAFERRRRKKNKR